MGIRITLDRRRIRKRKILFPEKMLKNLFDPPLKDNVAVPDAGFTVIRFLADNVGYWLFHCHMSWHNHLGMGLVIKVGDVENTIQPPPKGFPTCGDFVGCLNED